MFGDAGDMKITRAIACFAGSTALAGLALAGLSALAPVDGNAAQPKYYVDFLLLVLFWIAYVIFMISVLVWLGGKVFGRGAERDATHGIVED